MNSINNNNAIYPAKKLAHSRTALALLAALLLISVAYFYTYPINVGKADNSGYLKMIQEGSSNLIFAPGYPAVFSMLLNTLDMPPNKEFYDVAWIQRFQLVQLLVHVACFSLLYYMWINIFGRLSAGIAALFLGLCPIFLAASNSVAPEWLQGYLMIFSFLLAIKAMRCDHQRKKLLLYLVATTLFTAAYLTKYNSLLLLPFLICILIGDNIAPLRKTIFLLVLTIFCASLIQLFIAKQHYPTTGEKQLNFDHGWVLITSLARNHFKQPLEKLGVNSKRWMAVSYELPSAKGYVNAYGSESDIASPEVRQPYIDKYDTIMALSEKELSEIISTSSSSNTKETFKPIPFYWYIGLSEADSLGIAVYKEALLTFPKRYLDRSIKRLGTVSLTRSPPVPLFVTENQNTNKTLYKIESSEKRPRQQMIISAREGINGPHLPYWNPSITLWKPGARFFETISWHHLPGSITAGMFLFAVLGICISNPAVRPFGILTLGVIAIFLIASSLLLGIRNKELIAIMPFIAISLGIALSSFFQLSNGLYRNSSTPKPPSQAIKDPTENFKAGT